MLAIGGVEVQLLLILNSALEGSVRSASLLGRFGPVKKPAAVI